MGAFCCVSKVTCCVMFCLIAQPALESWTVLTNRSYQNLNLRSMFEMIQCPCVTLLL